MPQDQDDIKGADAMKQAPTPGPLSGDDWTPAKGSNPFPHGDNTPIHVRRDVKEWNTTASTFNWELWVEWKPLAPTAPVEASGSERDAFEKWYCDDAATVGIKMLPLEILALREGETYGPKRVALNSKWEAWQARADLRPQPSGETREVPYDRLTNYPDYISDADGLARIRSGLLEVKDWHDLPGPIVNCNSLARLLDTIEMQRAQIAALIRPAPVASGGQHSSGEGWVAVFDLFNEARYDPKQDRDLSELTDAVFDLLATTPVAETAGETVALKPETSELLSEFKAVKNRTPPVPAQDDDKLREAIGHMSWMRKFVPCVFDVTEDRLNEIDDFISQEEAALKSTAAQGRGE